MKTLFYSSMSLIGLALFSCQDKSSKSDDDKLKLTITETLNNDSAIYQLIKIDSVCARHFNPPSPPTPREDTHDTTLSLIELLGGKEELPVEDAGKAALKKAEAEHPFFFCLHGVGTHGM